MLTAGVFVLSSGWAWRMLPPAFGASVPTAHRRFMVWTKAGVWRRLHRAVLDELGGLSSDRLVMSGGRRGEVCGRKRAI